MTGQQKPAPRQLRLPIKQAAPPSPPGQPIDYSALPMQVVGETLAKITDEVGDLTAVVHRMRHKNRPIRPSRVSATRRRAPRHHPPVNPPWWNPPAADPAATERLRRAVADFGDYLIRTYIMTAVPLHWTDDPALMAEITALYVEWVGAYHDPRAAYTDPIHWHESIARFIDRVRHYEDRRRGDQGVRGVLTATPPPSAPLAAVPATAAGRYATRRRIPAKA